MLSPPPPPQKNTAAGGKNLKLNCFSMEGVRRGTTRGKLKKKKGKEEEKPAAVVWSSSSTRANFIPRWGVLLPGC
jgi:hypothetical protein